MEDTPNNKYKQTRHFQMIRLLAFDSTIRLITNLITLNILMPLIIKVWFNYAKFQITILMPLIIEEWFNYAKFHITCNF